MKTTSVKTQAFEGVFTSILLIFILVTTFSVLSLDGGTTHGLSERNAFVNLEVRPEFDAVSFDEIPTEEAALKEFAVMLYNMGGTNAKNIDALAAYCSCLMKMSVLGTDNYVDIDASLIKTQEEFFRIDYRIDRDMPFVNKLGALASSFEMITTERVYTNTEMDVLKYQKVRNSSRSEDGIPSADWTQEMFPEDRAVPVYNSTQEGIFEVIAYNISAAAISTVTVELVESEKGNYYSVKMRLAANNEDLTSRVIDTIRDGATDPNAHYLTVNYDFELWDNGYFKSARIYEDWEAHAMGMSFLSFSTTSDYNWKFSYDESDADPTNFVDCIAMKESLNG